MRWVAGAEEGKVREPGDANQFAVVRGSKRKTSDHDDNGGWPQKHLVKHL
jgi:hypothetical protein